MISKPAVDRREDARTVGGEFGVQPHQESGVVELELYFCTGCGRAESSCSADPCDGVIADRGETRPVDDEDHCTGCGRIGYLCSVDPCDGVLEDRGETRCLSCGRPQPDCNASPCFDDMPATNDAAPAWVAPARLEVDSTIWTIRDVQGLTFGFDPHADIAESLEIDSPYRIPKTWTEDQRRAFIGALLQGVPMAPVVVNDRMEEGWNDPGLDPGVDSPGYGVIDGEQRLRALHDFSISELSVPATWFPPHMIGRTELVDGETHVCCGDLLFSPKEMLKLPVSKMTLGSRAEEAKVRALLDPTGMPSPPAPADDALSGREALKDVSSIQLSRADIVNGTGWLPGTVFHDGTTGLGYTRAQIVNGTGWAPGATFLVRAI